MLKALIWDVDGTIAETERDGHRVAFNQAFADAGLGWHWSDGYYGPLLMATGGLERILADMDRRPDAPATPAAREALARSLHARKLQVYAERVAQGAISARPGVLRLMDEARAAGVQMAVATTSSGISVRALMRCLLGPDWPDRFTALVCAEEAPVKKPAPMVYERALQALGVQPQEAFALEDSPNGLQAARAAGIACGITRSAYFLHERYEGAAWVRPDLDTPDAMTLARIQQAVSANIAPT